MLNREKFAKEIVEIACKGEPLAVSKGKPAVCGPTACRECDFYGIPCYGKTQEWANSEYVELPIDWGKVLIDTPVLVRDSKCSEWICAYFAGYDDGYVKTWVYGATSWSVAKCPTQTVTWEYAKLAKTGY